MHGTKPTLATVRLGATEPGTEGQSVDTTSFCDIRYGYNALVHCQWSLCRLRGQAGSLMPFHSRQVYVVQTRDICFLAAVGGAKIKEHSVV